MFGVKDESNNNTVTLNNTEYNFEEIYNQIDRLLDQIKSMVERMEKAKEMYEYKEKILK